MTLALLRRSLLLAALVLFPCLPAAATGRGAAGRGTGCRGSARRDGASARRRRGRRRGVDRRRPLRGGDRRAAAAARAGVDRTERALPLWCGVAGGIAAPRPHGRGAGDPAGRGHRRLPRHAGAGAGAGAGAAGAGARVLPQARRPARAAPLRGRAGRRRARRGGRQRQPLPQRNQVARALELQRGLRTGAGLQHRRGLRGADHLYPCLWSAPAVRAGRGGA